MDENLRGGFLTHTIGLHVERWPMCYLISYCILCVYLIAANSDGTDYHHGQTNITVAAGICFELCTLHGTNSDIQISRQ